MKTKTELGSRLTGALAILGLLAGGPRIHRHSAGKNIAVVAGMQRRLG